MPETKKILEEDYYEPRFRYFKSRGPYPFNLFFGYENELELTEEPLYSFNATVEEIINQYPFLYAKEDCSLDCGCEFNTHPFNMNWFQKNGIIKYIDKLTEANFKAKRSCGFHIHLGRDYFTSRHLLKMAKMFYGYPDFIARVSQRVISNGMGYCKTKVTRDYQDWLCERKPINLRTISGCKEIVRYLRNSDEKYVALSLCHKNTLEVRIFQGTVNKKLIQAYLEFCLAVTLFTKSVDFEQVSPNGLRAYVKKNKRHYKNLIASGILGKKARKEYSWKIAA